jgi:hypothetical protein
MLADASATGVTIACPHCGQPTLIPKHAQLVNPEAAIAGVEKRVAKPKRATSVARQILSLFILIILLAVLGVIIWAATRQWRETKNEARRVSEPPSQAMTASTPTTSSGVQSRGNKTNQTVDGEVNQTQAQSQSIVKQTAPSQVRSSSAENSPAQIVIGGSSTITPLHLWGGTSFRGITSHLNQSSRFVVPDGGPFWVQEIQVGLFHYEGMKGDRAFFVLCADNEGEPGQILTTFQEISGISSIPQIFTAKAQGTLRLKSGMPYWLVGSTSENQVNWLLDEPNKEVQTASRVNGSTWQVRKGGNNSSFILLGTRQ